MVYTPFVNAHINNISFPKTIEELEYFIYERKSYDIEYLIEECNNYSYVVWTVPRNSIADDIVLFFHAKTAIQWIRKLETATKNSEKSESEKKILMDWLQKARNLYSLYGGKIFAIGKVSSQPRRECLDEIDKDILHWSGRIYAEIDSLFILEKPIDISEFNSFLLISRQSAITSIPSPEYIRLKNIIIEKNKPVPHYFYDSKIGNLDLSKTNIKNFIDKTKTYRTRFLLEANFRSYYVDFFIQILTEKKFYRECQCHTDQNPLARVDNIFEFKNKKFLLEVKLNILLEKDLISQLHQYIDAEYIYLSNEHDIKTTDFERNYMYVIDVFSFYKFTPQNNQLIKLFDLDEINSNEDIISKFINKQEF